MTKKKEKVKKYREGQLNLFCQIFFKKDSKYIKNRSTRETGTRAIF